MTTEEKTKGLELLRKPFPDNQIGKLAKGSKAQMQCNANEKKNCSICGGWHHPKLIHLDFVGHAALTDRLLDVDPLWTWEPMAFDDVGLPAFDTDGGLWIRVTVLGRSMLGYGNAEPSQYKEIGSRQKECIGDALRNACMRLGAALELWHKGDLHATSEPEETPEQKAIKQEQKGTTADTGKFADETLKAYQKLIEDAPDRKTRDTIFKEQKDNILADCGADGLTEISKLKMTLNKLEA